MTAPITVLLGALGGEGGGVLAEWLYLTAVASGHHAQSTSIPGVAQRTGATTYYVEIDAEPVAADARPPVFSLNPVPGAIDLLVSSELLETARQAAQGLPSAERTFVISSTARSFTVAEKMQATDGRVDSARLLAVLQRHARCTELLDFGALARAADTSTSAVLLGAIAASDVLPFARGAYEATIRATGKGVEASLRGFALAFQALREQRARQAAIADALQPAPRPDLRVLARRRLTQYQDASYAELYDARLARVEAIERELAAGNGRPAGSDGALLGELSRWLALWMAFDDIVRVAALKLSAARLARVRAEVAARDDEIVKVFDHFKPGVPEFAGLLPSALAARLVAWERRRVAAGREPWSLPLKLGAHTLWGALALRGVASLKRWRPRGSRFGAEQRLIEHWLAAVERGLREHWTLGFELACCGRLVKGYGSTNERGKQNLQHIIEHLAFGASEPADRAAAVRAARTAAFADDTDRAFDLTLAAHAAPPRPVREQTIRWFKRRPMAP